MIRRAPFHWRDFWARQRHVGFTIRIDLNIKLLFAVIAALTILLTWLTAGVRMAIYSAGFLSYMGLLGL